jgi:hypothetical protein
MRDELEEFWKEAVVAWGSIPAICLEGLRKPTKTMSGYPVWRPRFEPSTSRIQVECVGATIWHEHKSGQPCCRALAVNPSGSYCQLVPTPLACKETEQLMKLANHGRYGNNVGVSVTLASITLSVWSSSLLNDNVLLCIVSVHTQDNVPVLRPGYGSFLWQCHNKQKDPPKNVYTVI